MSNTKRDLGQARMTIGSFLKFALGWPISLIALFFIAKIVISNGKSVLPNINNINIPLLILGVFFFILYYFIRAYVWKTILKLQGYDMPFKDVAYLWELSEFKRFAPGKIWAFIGRSSLFGKMAIPQKTIFKSILIEIQFLLLANIIVSILAFPFIFKYIISVPSYNLISAVAILLILLTTIIFIFSNDITRHSGLSRVSKRLEILDAPLQLTELTRMGFEMTYRFINALWRFLPSYSAKTKTSLLLISSLHALIFGIGTYFTAISIVYLETQLFIQIVGFFVFSFLVSYISFITPMGIGVREGITTIGLAKIIPLAASGVVSIFARIVLIFSELCFLCFVYFWKSAKNKYILFLENFISHRKQEVVLFLLTIAFIAYFTFASFLRYDNFYTGQFDLGNMDQAVWNTMQGRIFQTNDQNSEIISRLAFHADFILILLSPLYLIWEHPKMLLLVQSVVLGIGAVFVYLIGKKVIKNKTVSFVIATCFLLNPAVQFTNLYDFHAVALATTFLLGAFYFLLTKKYILMIFLLFLAGITKEQIWLIAAIFGLYIISQQLFSSKDTPSLRSILVIGVSLFMASSVIFYLLIWHAIPNAKGAQHFALSYYSDFGDSPTDVIKNIFFSPQKTLGAFFQKDQLNYLNQLFLPLGFLSLLSPLHLIFALPDLFINLLSSNSKLHEIYYQYSAAITPFIFISAIFGIKTLKEWFPKISYTLPTFCLLLSTIYSSYLFGPLPFAKKPNIDMFTKPQKNKIEIENFISNIPTHYSVAATNNIGSHLSQRQKIFTIPNGIGKADFVIFLLNEKRDQESFEKEIKIMENSKNYKQAYKINESFMVFERLAK